MTDCQINVFYPPPFTLKALDSFLINTRSLSVINGCFLNVSKQVESQKAPSPAALAELKMRPPSKLCLSSTSTFCFLLSLSLLVCQHIVSKHMILLEQSPDAIGDC